MSTEKYLLSWLQSPSDFANSQEVLATVNEASIIIATDLLMNVNGVEFDFPTDADVEWWVVTKDITAKTVDSVHDVFKAVNLTTLEPAINLSNAWISHTA